MPFSVCNRVSCSAIKVLGKKLAKQRFGRLSATKELDGECFVSTHVYNSQAQMERDA